MKHCKKCQAETERYKNGQCKPCLTATNAAYRAANIDKCRALTVAWQKANPERRKATDASWKKANPDRCRAYEAAWYKANKKSKSAWQKANLEKRRIYAHNRNARKRANGGVLSKGLTEKLFKLQRGKCPCCKKPLGDNYHLDHIMPLDLGGANEDWNMQLLRQTCNQQKHAKNPIDFMQSRGFLI